MRLAEAEIGGQCEIGPFLLDARAEMLTRDGTPLPLGRRAVALLLTLLERPGELVTKDELMARVWKGLAVEEGNLAAQVAALRRALAAVPSGDEWIETLPRRGYRWRGPLHWLPDTAPSQRAAPAHTAHAQTAHAHTAHDRPSVAVLPFQAVPAGSVPELLTDGLAEDVLSALSRLEALTVISRNSSFRLRDAGLDTGQVGAALGARYVFGGTMRAQASTIRIGYELAEAAPGIVLLSRSRDTRADQVFAEQDQIVAEIVRALAPRVRDHELARIHTADPADLRAYELVLQARALMHTLQPDALDKAEPLLLRAATLDPQYALPWTLQAELHSLRLGQGWATNRAAETEAAERCVNEALARNPHDAHALARLGHTRALLHRDHATALTLFKRALEADPNSPIAWLMSSMTYSFLGDGPTGIAHGEQALRLSPRDWYGFRFHMALSLAHYTASDYAEAAHHGAAAIAESGRDLSSHGYLIASLAAAGDMTAATRLAADIAERWPPGNVAGTVARHPYADPARRERYGQHLLAAGLS